MFAGNIGGGAKDEAEAGSYRTNGGPVPRGEQEGEASAAGPVCEEHENSHWYARFVLRHEARRIQPDKQTIVLAVRTRSGPRTRKRARLYDEKVLTPPLKLWRLMDTLAGKRLQRVNHGTRAAQ